MRISLAQVTNWGGKRVCNQFVDVVACMWLITLLSGVCNADTQTQESGTLTRTTDALIIEGRELPGMTEHDISMLRLFSLKKGILTPIPFQIDQREADDNWVWDIESGAERTHDNEDPEGRDIFDANDLLVFLAKDAGDRITKGALLAASADFTEITLTDPVRGTRGWVYFAHFFDTPPALADGRYMRYEKDEKTVTSPNYAFSYSDQHLVVLDSLLVNGRSILDRTKVRGRVKAGVAFIKFDIEFNEEEVGGYVEGYINGPVRIVKRSVDYIDLGGGLRTPDVFCDHFFYPEYAEVPVLLSMNFPVDKISLRVTADYFGAPFTRAHAESLAKPVSFQRESADRNLLEDAADARWVALDGPGGSVITLIKVPESIQSHTLISPWLVSNPSGSFTPESITGADPEAGFNVETDENFPSGDYVLHAVYLLSPRPYQSGDAVRATELLHNPIEVKTEMLR
jgi:hypothetical protein